MKVYQVTMPYFDGDHDHGSYRSPLFAKKEDAEKFKRMLIEVPESDHDRRWWSDEGWQTYGPENAVIKEIEIAESCPVVIEKADEYLHITWS